MSMTIRSFAIVFFLLAAASSTVKGQDISGGVDLTFGGGTTLFGISGRYEKSFEKQFDWMVTAGLDFGSGITLFTLQGGAKYTLQENVYLGAEIGPIFGSGGGGSETRIAFTPTIGYKWDKFDLSGRFFLGSGVNFFDVRFAYVFNK